MTVPPAGLCGLVLKVGGGAVVAGRVRWDSGEPARSVQVIADGPQASEEARTDNDGAFRIGGLPAGAYRVRVLRSGFPIWIRTPGSRRNEIEIQLGTDEQRSGLTLALTAPRATVRGLVRDDEGHPIERAEVQAMEEQEGGGALSPQRDFPFHAKTVTDSDGRFHVPRIPAGRYRLHVRHPDFQPLDHPGATTDGEVNLRLLPH